MRLREAFMLEERPNKYRMRDTKSLRTAQIFAPVAHSLLKRKHRVLDWNRAKSEGSADRARGEGQDELEARLEIRKWLEWRVRAWLDWPDPL